MTRKRDVLILCTGNCCRSQMAEAILRHIAGDRFNAYSAGSEPAGFVHPLAIAALERLGIPLGDDARSKSWDEFRDRPMDLVITVCDSADRICPAWTGKCLKSHWPVPDPSFVPGDDEDRREFAVRVAERLRMKLECLKELDFDGADRESLQRRLDAISQM